MNRLLGCDAGLAVIGLVLGELAGVAAAQPSARPAAAARLAQAEAARAAQTRAAETAARDLTAARAQAARLADARAQSAAASRTTEQQARSTAIHLRAASAEEQAVQAALTAREVAFARTLPVLLWMERFPSPAVLLTPTPGPAAGLVVLRGTARTLWHDAAALRMQQAEAARRRGDEAQQLATLDQAAATAAAHTATLDRSVQQAASQVTQAEAAGRDAALAIADLGAQAQTLRQAVAAMDAAQAQAEARSARDTATARQRGNAADAGAARARQAALARPTAPPLAHAAGRLVSPVSGPVLHAFGTQADDGPATGVTFAAAPGAPVASPCAGRVAFAAPFRSYGRLLIVECGGGYDVVLAGLGRLDASPGHAVRPGEPVGRMPASAARPPLYVEMRAGGQPVDPLPFLRAKL